LLIGAGALLADEKTTQFDRYGFSVRSPDGWHVAAPEIIKMFSVATHKGIVAHAKKKVPNLDPAGIESEILFLVTKHPLGAREDNPNVTISVEKSWNPTPQDTGATYLALLGDRFKVLAAPSVFIGDPQELKIGAVRFFMQEAVNDKVPDAVTRQLYSATNLDGYYLTFVISFNAKEDPDYQAMKSMVESFAIETKIAQPTAP